jgi:curved DNA-binding protein CbpA
MVDGEPHEVLGVARDASEEEVRAAYRDMVKKHHPDVSDAEDAEERFVKIRDAYEVMRERVEGKKEEQNGNSGSRTEPSTEKSWGGAESETKSSTRSEHKRRQRERRKSWEDPWGNDTKNGESGREERNGEEKTERKESDGRVEGLGYGWTLFREYDGFSVSKTGGRGRVYVGREGNLKREKHVFGSRLEAEKAYEAHVRNREERRNTFSLKGGWRMVQRASGYAVEGKEGYLGVDGSLQDKPYWFRSQEEAKRVYESYAHDGDGKTRNVKNGSGSESLASRVTVGAALLPFLATVTILNVLSSSLGLGTKGKNPYLTTALTSAFLGTLAVVLKGYYPLVSFILLSLAVWAGVEFTVMIAGPYTADEIEG